MSNVRLVAADLLSQLLSHQGSIKSLLPSYQARCLEPDRPLLSQLCFGTLRDLPQLEEIAFKLLKKPFQRKDADIYALLLLGLYQLRSMRIPAHAAINETVESCDQLNKSWSKGLMNAVLRNFQRQQVDIEEQLSDLPSYRYNHPDWFIQKLKHNWPEQWQQILEANNQRPPMTLRVNQQRTNRTEYLEQLQSLGIAATASPYSPVGITLEQPCDVSELPQFEEGFISVQDEAAQLAAALLAPEPGMRVLDACAAPGGKLGHLLESVESLRVDALELSANRLPMIESNLHRLTLSANVIAGDASQADWWDGELYDQILLDAPCSASGVIRRNPDIKYLRQGEDLHSLSALQRDILENLWPMLKAGGKMLYATCSVFSQENSRQIKRFCADHSDASCITLDVEWGHSTEYGRQLFPMTGGHDGFYYALLQKQA